jgi:hypothetical protein
MPVMEAVWPITALHFGPVALGGYRRTGRPSSGRWLRQHGTDHPPVEPRWAGVAVDASPGEGAPRHRSRCRVRRARSRPWKLCTTTLCRPV